MPHDRFFIDQPFTSGQTLSLEAEELRHLYVMRLRSGEMIELVNGRNQLAEATIESLSKTSAQVKIRNLSKTAEPKLKVILAQALPRLPRLEWLMEKAVELNISEFWLFPSAHSEKNSLTTTQLARLKSIAISALKQSGRLDLPEIHLFPSLDKLPQPNGSLFFGDLRPTAPSFLEIWKKTPKLSQPMVFFVGPEKGFTEKELLFLEKEKKAQGVHLHANVLRVETAAIVGAALLQELFN